MYRKIAMLCTGLLLIAGLTGCSGDTVDSSVPETTAPPVVSVSRNLCYLTGNGTTDPDEITSFTAQLETDGYTWSECTISEIPADTDAVILNSPTEDLTRDEMDSLNAYMDNGGHLLLLLPANEGETRYKYLSQFLEKYCIAFDYDRISETDMTRTIGEDAYFIQTDYIARPDNMPLYSSAQDSGIVYLENARSFHFFYQDHFSRVKQDVILKTASSVIGAPYGGTEDDPLTYEGTALDVMGYARHEENANASVVFLGASSFLNDENYSAETSAAPIAWVHSALDWFVLY